MSDRNSNQSAIDGSMGPNHTRRVWARQRIALTLMLSMMTLQSGWLAADEFVGVVKQIDLVTGTLTVSDTDAKGDTTFTFGRSSRIRTRTGPTTLIMLQIGQPVTVQHQGGSKRADLVVAGKAPQTTETHPDTPSKLPTSPLVVYQRGTLPIIITAPHGGRQAIPEAPERSNKNIKQFRNMMDTNTQELAQDMVRELSRQLPGRPWVILARFHRKFADANRPAHLGTEHPSAEQHHRVYHLSVQDAIRQVNARWEQGVLIDVHGQARLPDVFWRGTRTGRTMGGLIDKHGWDVVEGPHSIFGNLRAQGHHTHPPRQSDSESPYSGGFTSANYGFPFGIDAIQIEIGKNLRLSRESYSQTALDLARSIRVFHDNYLSKSPRRNPESQPDQAKPRITHGPFVGHVTSGTALIWARCSAAGEYQLTARGSGDTPAVRATTQPTPEHDWCVVWKLEPLQAATRYRYQITVRGKPLLVGDDFFFITPRSATQTGRSQSEPVRLTFGSCAREDAGSAAVWRQMAASNPHAVVLLGDTPYIDSTELAVQRQRYREFAAVPEFSKLVRNRSLYGTWDDHDFGRNDTDGNLPGKARSRRVFIEYRANPSFGDGRGGIYTKFRRGAVEVFLLDTRYFAATEPSPFAADRKSLLGARQWDWLFRELKASTAPFKVLACGMIWNAGVRPGKLDHWGTYPHELRALFEFIGRERITGIVLVGGDVHRTRFLRHRSTATAGYRIPELITSPVHDGVIANANAPHPGLIHDAGEPNTFLQLTVGSPNKPDTMQAAFLNKQGQAIYQTQFTEQDLAPASRGSTR